MTTQAELADAIVSGWTNGNWPTVDDASDNLAGLAKSAAATVLARATPERPETPEWWVLVPVEPTKAMVSRFRGLNRVRDTEARARLDYATMLSAAPPAPGGDQ